VHPPEREKGLKRLHRLGNKQELRAVRIDMGQGFNRDSRKLASSTCPGSHYSLVAAADRQSSADSYCGADVIAVDGFRNELVTPERFCGPNSPELHGLD